MTDSQICAAQDAVLNALLRDFLADWAREHPKAPKAKQPQNTTAEELLAWSARRVQSAHLAENYGKGAPLKQGD